jgi:GNAT superfamily N-acetyltransferase
MAETKVRKANSGDLDELIPVVARAFQPQPLTCWLLGSGRSAMRRGQRLIELEFEKALPYGLTYTTTDRRGAAIWHPPNKKLELWSDLLWSFRSAAAIGIGWRTVSHIITGLRMALLEPKKPHYYLAILGVDPEAQGEGIGSILLEPCLALCDRERTPAYLVTDTEDAARFYRRQGFEIKHKVPGFKSDFTLRAMWRRPS